MIEPYLNNLRTGPWARHVLLATLVLLAVAAGPAWGLTPESPEVKKAVARGLAFLQTASELEERAGAVSLVGMCFSKTDAAPNHPMVKRAVAKIQQELKEDGEFHDDEQIYHLGISMIFLASIDSDQYNGEMRSLMQLLLRLQKPHGAWGYPNMLEGDTSMTQYGVLSLWDASQHGIPVPLQSWERVCNWLLRTQDPRGAFGYQGHDPGNYSRVRQQEIRPSMAAAGLGGLYICLDHFDIGQSRSRGSSKPSALKEVEEAGQKTAVKEKPVTVDPGRLGQALGLGDTWFSSNFQEFPQVWPYYYLYAYERYRSFKELAEKDTTKEPKWYTDIGNNLLKRQQNEGSWVGGGDAEVVSTAFAILFLIRSTKKSIGQALGAGTLVGGRGLPTDMNNVQMAMGSVKAKPLAGPAAELLDKLGDPADPEFLAAIEGLAERPLEPDDSQLPKHLVKLRKLAGGKSPEARAAAIKVLGRTRDLDSAPLLIFAMGDDDFQVVKEARDGLRFVSRKFFGVGLEFPCTDLERRQAIEKWKRWYLSIRPDYQFDD